MRSKGHSFARIARTLGYERAVDANHAFNRALRRQPDDQRDDLRRQETARLDTLAARIQADPGLDATEVARQLKAVERLRERLAAD